MVGTIAIYSEEPASEKTDGGNGSITRNKEVINRLYNAIGRNSAADFSDLVAESHVDHSNGRNGPAGFVAAAANIHQAYSDFSIELQSVVAEDDWVIARWHETGVHTGQFFN